MKYLKLFCLSFICVGWLTGCVFSDSETDSSASTLPNIIVFMVDDMGWMDTSVPFHDQKMPLNELYHTPHMESMAESGMKFRHAYAQPVCTPTRVSYLTGMNAARTRVTNWISPHKNTPSDAKDSQFSPLSWNMNGLSTQSDTENTIHATPLPELLREKGYHTIHIGKAHWGSEGTPGADPLNLGFMKNIAGHAGGHPQSYLSRERFGNIPGKAQPQAVPDLEKYYDQEIFLTEALTREAILAMETPVRNKEPFFLNMSHYALHTPIMADQRFVQKYYDLGIDSTEAQYASLIEGMDKSLGDIMHFLDENNLTNQTVILFVSDNGGLDHHQRAGDVNTHNHPLRSGKGSIYEGGIRVPMIVKWPAVISPGTSTETPVIIEDFFSSILEIAGIDSSNIPQKTDAVSFVPLLKNPDHDLSERPLIFHYPHAWIPISPDENLGINYYSAVRMGDWKLIYRLRDQSFQLYNIVTDIEEKNDLKNQHLDKVRQLAQILGETLKSRGAQMPVDKNTGLPVPFPDEVSGVSEFERSSKNKL